MGPTKQLILLIALSLCCLTTRAQTADSVDVANYDITLDLSAGAPFKGVAELTVRLLRPCASISLQLVGTVDSVEVAGQRLSTTSLKTLPTNGIAAGEPFVVKVWYRGRGYVEPEGWGGFHFDGDISYNLGVGFDTDPHVLGRAVFPCRDNFTDKATYTLRVTTKSGWTAECGGMRQSVHTDSLGREHSVWRIAQPTPTYLVSVSQAPWTRMTDTVASLYADYPLSVGYRNHSEADVRTAFAALDTVVPMFERCFGPYRWGRIGYIATPKGSMEHVNNIALDRSFVASTSERAQSTIAHELGHAWFGNLLTCATEGDMWINEGGASFCSEVAMEAAMGREASRAYYQRNLEAVLRTTHVTDRAYRALHNMPHEYTYGSTTYDKGWMVWHSLRGYLGDTLFYASMNRLMESCAFSNIDAIGLRDSLSLYSGVDLTDFFQFHVFSPGFIDYHVAMSSPADGCIGTVTDVVVEQRGVGTWDIEGSARVPVTFFAAQPADDGRTMYRTVLPVSGETSEVSVRLPFVPSFCVLDLDCELSDAATVSGGQLDGGAAELTMDEEHLKVNAGRPVTLYAEHHWSTASGTLPEGVVRQARRYWMLRGQWQRDDGVKAGFRIVCGNAGNYAGLDAGFYTNAATVDSLALFYRPEGGEAWSILPSTRTGTANEGFLVADSLLPGEYTIAVVDHQRLSITAARMTEVQLFPNPLTPGQAFTVDVDTDAPFTVRIIETGGRVVWEKTGCHKGEEMSPRLAKGTYFVRIENNFISLQSKLIQL